jgi:DNA gyrase subunit A
MPSPSKVQIFGGSGFVGSELVKQIAALITEKKLPDVSDIRDESSKGKVRVVIELKKDVDPKYKWVVVYK